MESHQKNRSYRHKNETINNQNRDRVSSDDEDFDGMKKAYLDKTENKLMVVCIVISILLLINIIITISLVINELQDNGLFMDVIIIDIEDSDEILINVNVYNDGLSSQDVTLVLTTSRNTHENIKESEWNIRSKDSVHVSYLIELERPNQQYILKLCDDDDEKVREYVFYAERT